MARITLIIIILFTISGTAPAQSLINIIKETEKTVFEARSYNKEGNIIARASGFFISPNGLAITMGSIFETADSAAIEMRNGKKYIVERIISIHPYTNLALIKIKPIRSKPFHYLLPSHLSYRENEELLTMALPYNKEDGTYLAPISKITHFPYISRTGIITKPLRPDLNGAPAINHKGQLIGIINGHPKKIRKIVYNSYLLNDTNWINLSISIGYLRQNPNITALLSPKISQGIYYILIEDHINAAHQFSHLLNPHKNAETLCMRAYARHKYNNRVGSHKDFYTCSSIDPDYFLQYYFKGMINLEDNKKDDARINFALCLNHAPNYAPAIVQLAKLNLEKQNNIQEAYNRFSEAILHDSLEAKAYYERSRLRFKYSKNRKGVIEDINKAIYLDPNLQGIYTIRGILKAGKQDLLGAIEDYNRAIKKNPADVHAYIHRGIANYNIGLREEACKDWSKAGKLGSYEAFKYLSRYCKKVKQSIYP